MFYSTHVDELQNLLPEVQALVYKRLTDLKSGRVLMEKLIVHQTLSRELDHYRSPSPAAIAARRLAEAGKTLRPGQSIHLIYTLGEPGVRAWDLPESPDPQTLNLALYKKLFLRAVRTILESLSIPGTQVVEGVKCKAQTFFELNIDKF